MLRLNRLNTKPFFKAIKMKVSNFDLKKNDIPIDSTARKVVYSTGFYEEYKNPSSQKLSKTPLPTRQIPSDVEDLTGTKKGSLTCVGLYGGFEVGKREKGKNRSKPSGHGWVCRCSCGNYTIRRAKSLKKKTRDACIECEKNLYYRGEAENQKRNKK